jgi:hypothetical protein
MIEVRATREADLAGLSALFAERFGHPLTAEEWSWKYRQLPGAARSVVAVDAAGAVVAHAGTICLAARWRSGAREIRGGVWQLVDFVGSVRGGGLRPALVEVGRQLLAGLPAPGDVQWIYGFPSERHFHFGARVFGYQELTRIVPLAGALPDSAAAGSPPPFESGDSCGDWAAAVWEECGAPGVERRAAFLNWRYWARPGRYYRFYRLRSADGAAAEGLAVFAFVGEEAWAAELWLPPRGEWYAPLLAVAGDLRAAGLRLWRFWPPPSPAGGGGGRAPRLDPPVERAESAEPHPPADPLQLAYAPGPRQDERRRDRPPPGPLPAAARLGPTGPTGPTEPVAALLWRLGLRPEEDVRFVAYLDADGGGPGPAAAAAGFHFAMGDFDLA